MANNKMKILPNGIAVLEGDTHISTWVEESGRLDHDRWLVPKVLQYIPEGGTVVDAGAYIADHTIAYAQKVGSTGKVYAFEPNAEAYKCARHNLQHYRQALCFNSGLSDKEETVSIIFPNENFGMANLAEGTGVECMPLDKMNLEACHFIKIDVEGYELKVLQGAVETIRKHRPVMLIEINTHTLTEKGIAPGDIFNYLHSLGYSYRNIDDSGRLDLSQFDVLCLPN